MNKELRKIFAVLILFGFGEGLFYNFIELWMQENSLSIKTVSTIFSLCSLLSVLLIFLFSNLIKKHRLRGFISSLLVLKGLLLLLLFLLNGSGQNYLIKLFVMLERSLNTEIAICFYPLMSLIKMDNKIYGKKDIYYNLFYYLSLLISGIILGKSLGPITINYNSYAIISSIIIFIAYIILRTTKINVKEDKKDNNNEIIIFELLKKAVKDKPSVYYFGFLFFGQVAYYSVLGLAMTFLTESFKFDPNVASNIRVYLGIASSLFAMFALRFLTFKNDYVNIGIKYIIRAVFFILALITLNEKIYFIAFAVPLFLSTSYSHVTCAPYINRYAGKYQLAFCNLRGMICYLGNFLGYYVCGLCYQKNIWFNYLYALIFIIVMLFFAYTALYYRNKEVK